MKKIFTLFAMCMFVCNTFAQEDTYGRISINAFVPTNENIPAEAARNLENKLKRMITANGMADNGLSERFVLTAKIDITSKDIVPTTPSRVSQKMDVTLYIGDIIENKVYGDMKLSIAGIGTNETKSFITAFQRIQTNTPAVQEFINGAKQRIAEYYEQNCDAILTESNRLTQNQQYDEALYKLVLVPNICNECFERCQTLATSVFQQKINHEGKVLMQQARSAWVTKKDYASAEKAMALLAQINPNADCISQANTLATEINGKLRADEQREYEFKMQQYADELEIKKARMAAIENIASAFAKNLPKTINKTNIIRSW